MCPKQVHEGSFDLRYVLLSVVMIDWGNLRGQIFSRTGFAPSGGAPNVARGVVVESAQFQDRVRSNVAVQLQVYLVNKAPYE